ncbi:MAG: glycosyltransferase family 4 protein [Candidatus Roizmanbacteria bacterium]|nr:glycosyltransferase family 4 protein [Candidatus Roizmanbacteria bacterium]
MKIVIDCRLWEEGGVGRYIRNLVSRLQKLDTHNFYTLLTYGNPNIQINNSHFHVRSVSSRWHSLSEQTVFLYNLLKEQADLVHFPYFSHPVLYNRPFVITLHDITPFTHATGQATTRHPLLYAMKKIGYRQTLMHALTRSKHVLVPTNAVAHDIRTMGTKTSITVTYEGVDESLIQARPIAVSSAKEPFLLYVGNFFPHKNISFLLTSYAKVPKAPKLILVGPDDVFTQRMRSQAHMLNLENRILFLHAVSDGQLRYLYSNAQALVFPSQSEGFGLPVLEASYFGCPLILSSIASFKEIAVPGTTFFNLHNEESLMRVLEESIQVKKTPYPDAYKKKFSFETMAMKTLAIYNTSV